MRRIHVIVILLGLGLFTVLIARIGVDALVRDAAGVGWWFVPIIVLSGVEHWMHAMGWRLCMEPSQRPGRLHVFGAHLAGNAISFVTPTATVGGEVVRAALMPPGYPAQQVVAVLTIDRLAWSLADAALALAGVTCLLILAPLSMEIRWGLLSGLVAIAVGVGVFLWLQRRGTLVSVLTGNRIVRKLCGPAFVDRLARGGAEIDGRIRAFHQDRSGTFQLSIALHFAGTCMGATQLACFLWSKGLDAGIGTLTPLFLVGVAVDLVAFFVPARIGVQEGSRELATSLMGLGSALGLVYSLVLRVEQVLWTGVGLIVYGVMARRRRASLLAREATG